MYIQEPTKMLSHLVTSIRAIETEVAISRLIQFRDFLLKDMLILSLIG